MEIIFIMNIQVSYKGFCGEMKINWEVRDWKVRNWFN